MIVDLRIYEVRPNRVDEFVRTYHQYAWPLQTRHLGRCLGWYVGVEGHINQVVHLWAYEDQADRERRRAALWADSEWQAYLKRVGEMGLLLHTENHIVAPTEFSPRP
jgi:hypothetical protein